MMYAVEFEAQIKDGTIHIPDRYRQQLGDRVRVILLADKPAEETPDLIQQLLENPIHLPDFTPLTREEAHERS